MKGKLFFIMGLAIGFLLTVKGTPLHAQKTPKTLTILYSNNINGEIEPCPT